MLSVLSSSDKKEAKEHVSNLVDLAKADGELHASEIKMIKKVGQTKGLSEREVEKMLFKEASRQVQIPEKVEARFDQLFELVELMMADGIISDKEMDFCSEMAQKMGFSPVIVGVLVAKIERGISGELTKSEIREESAPFIYY